MNRPLKLSLLTLGAAVVAASGGYSAWYEYTIWSADRLCRKYHFDREGDDGRSCVVEGARSADGSRTYWAVSIETAAEHELEAINASAARLTSKPREERSKGK